MPREPVASAPLGEAGPGVDARGQAVLDPTKNVLDLVNAAVIRLNDLRDLDAKYSEKLRTQADAHIHEIMAMRDRFETTIRVQESARIDAIRAVDVAAVARQAEVQATQAATLAAAVATSAETLRGQVAATAGAAAVNLATSLEPITTSIAALQRSQYELQGQAANKQESKGTNQWVFGAVLGAMALVLAAAGFFISLSRSADTSTPTPIVCTVEAGVTTCK